MENPGAITFLILFMVTTALEYFAVRRRWLPINTTALIGGIASAVFFVLFSLSRSNPVEHALVVGPLLGLLFTGLTVAAAAFFRNNEQSKQASRPPLPPSPPTE